MSISSGTATDYDDLLNKLVNFLTTDATLTAASQNWTLLHSSTASGANGYGDTWVNDVILKAPGLSTTEAIYIEIEAYNNTGYWGWRLRGATGYNSAQQWDSQPGASPDCFLPLWNTSIPYTFVANGQRVIVIAQIGTVFESCYLGKFLPYGQPSQYPYPLFIGGSTQDHNRLVSDTTGDHSAFFDPRYAVIYWIDGSWQQFQNMYGNPQTESYNGRQIWPYSYGGGANVPNWMQPNLDGSYPLFPVRLEMFSTSTFPATGSSSPPANELGELDGVFFIPGVSIASGTTVTISGVTYLVVQNCFRTAVNGFAAIKEV